jgi:hypothetical protein
VVLSWSALANGIDHLYTHSLCRKHALGDVAAEARLSPKHSLVGVNSPGGERADRKFDRSFRKIG